MQQLIEGQVLTTNFWPHAICLLTEMNDHPSSLVFTSVSSLNHIVIIGFIEQNYHYKAVIMQIHPDAGLTTIPYTDQTFLPC